MTTLAQLANDYWQSTLSDEEKIKAQIQGLAQNNNNINLSDLQSMFSSTANFTGSGRQGSGMANLEDLYFDANGNVLLKPQAGQLDPNLLGTDGYTPPSYITGDTITNTSKQDGGWDFYDPYAEAQAALGDIGGLLTVNGNYLKYDQLTPEQQQQLRTSGLFPNIDESSLKSNQKLPSQFSLDQTGSVMDQYLQIEKDRISNVSRPESDEWLMNDGIGTLFSGLGTALGVPFLNLSSNIMNTGNAIDNGAWGSALMGGLGVYNTAGGIANNAAMSVGPQQPENLYDQFNPSQYIAQDLLGIDNPTLGQYVGNAAVDSGVAALDGRDVGDAFRNSLVNTTASNIGQSLGLPSFVSGMLGSGISYLFDQPSYSTVSAPLGQPTPQPGQTTNPPATTTTPTQQTPPPYSLTNPTTVPTYTNPLAGVTNPYSQTPYSQVLPMDLEEGADDESDTNNPYNTFVNYSGSGQNVYG